MSNTIRGKALTGALGLMAVLGAAGEAAASGFQLREQSTEGLGNAFAGSTAKAYDVSTIFYNPAGMTRLDGTQTGLSLAYIRPVAKFSGSGTSVTGPGVPPSTGATSGGMGGDGVEDRLVPALYAMHSVSDDLKLGLAINVPFGLVTEYDHDWVGRYQAIRSDLRVIDIAPSVAYRVNSNLSLGAGVIFQYADAELTQAINNKAVNAALADGLARVEGDDWGYGYNLGALWEFSPTSRVGINYRSRIHHKLQGQIEYQGVHALVANMGQLFNSPGSAELTTPDTATIGIYHEINPQWAVVSDVSWTNWSVFNHLTVVTDNGHDPHTDENWKDTFFFSLGGIYKPNDKWTLRAGIAYDTTPVSDAHRTARIPDADRYWLAGGVSYELSPAFQIHAGYTHIFADEAKLNETTDQGTLVGTYDAHVDIFSASVVWKF